MRTIFFKLFCLMVVGIVVLSACNLPVSDATTEAAPQTKPASANATATIEANAAQTEVVATATFTLTPTETPTSEPSSTATPEIPKAEVQRETNCRSGPAGNYSLVATYQAGQKLEVVGQGLGAGYWFVKNPDKPEEQCYLLAQNVSITGDTVALPKFTPQPSPTEAPYFNVKFNKFGTCKSQEFAMFSVENAGSVPFRSFYIKVTDLKLGKSVDQALNAFDQYVGCVLAKNIAPLGLGETGYVTSPPFPWSVNGHKLRAVIMLCTDKNLKGTCITQTVDLKP